MPFIYGKYPVQEFLKHHPKLAVKLWVTSEEKPLEASSKKFENETEQRAAYERREEFVKPTDLPFEEINNSMLKAKFRLRDFENHQGMVLEIKKDLNSILTTSLEELILECSNSGKTLLWLPSIQDGHNLGAVIRSSVAFGTVGGIIIPSANSVQLTATVAKISAGTIFSMKFAQFQNWGKTASNLKMNGLNLIAIEKRHGSKPLNEVKFDSLQPYVLVAGSEERGVPSVIRKQCDLSVEIPQSDEVDSLNLSVATAIVLYEIKRQRLAK